MKIVNETDTFNTPIIESHEGFIYVTMYYQWMSLCK